MSLASCLEILLCSIVLFEKGTFCEVQLVVEMVTGATGDYAGVNKKHIVPSPPETRHVLPIEHYSSLKHKTSGT